MACLCPICASRSMAWRSSGSAIRTATSCGSGKSHENRGTFMNHRSRLAAASLAASLITGATAHADGLRPDQAAFRDIYKELVETNTTLSAGNCTEAAEKMATRLRKAGYPDSDLHLFVAPDHPKEGGLVAILPGSDAK